MGLPEQGESDQLQDEADELPGHGASSAQGVAAPPGAQHVVDVDEKDGEERQARGEARQDRQDGEGPPRFTPAPERRRQRQRRRGHLDRAAPQRPAREPGGQRRRGRHLRAYCTQEMHCSAEREWRNIFCLETRKSSRMMH